MVWARTANGEECGYEAREYRGGLYWISLRALNLLVPEAGIEPARPFYERQILNLLCLPISPLGQTQSAIVIKTVSLVMRCNN